MAQGYVGLAFPHSALQPPRWGHLASKSRRSKSVPSLAAVAFPLSPASLLILSLSVLRRVARARPPVLELGQRNAACPGLGLDDLAQFLNLHDDHVLAPTLAKGTLWKHKWTAPRLVFGHV